MKITTFEIIVSHILAYRNSLRDFMNNLNDLKDVQINKKNCRKHEGAIIKAITFEYKNETTL